jgi:hypothetical protein
MSDDTRQEFLETLIRTYVPKDAKMQAKALEAVGLLAMQAERDTRHHREQSGLPESLQGPRAQKALNHLRASFRKVTGMNIFDTGSEELVRATWNTVRAIVLDERDKVSEGYRNSGIHDTPDLDALTELASMTEMPEGMPNVLWAR